MVIVLLGGVNFAFMLSWMLHGCEQNIVSTGAEGAQFLKSIKMSEPGNLDVQVEIFNACGVPDVARKLAEYLRGKNIDVVFYGNFMVKNKIRKISHTIVIDRLNTNRRNARKIANLIHADKNYVIHQLSPDRDVDVTILIGQDYEKLAPFQ